MGQDLQSQPSTSAKKSETSQADRVRVGEKRSAPKIHSQEGQEKRARRDSEQADSSLRDDEAPESEADFGEEAEAQKEAPERGQEASRDSAVQ